MTAGQQISFEPALALMLAQHFQHAAIGRDVIVAGNDFGRRTAVRHLEGGSPAIRGRFVRAKDAEGARIPSDHVADQLALDAGGFGVHCAGLRHLHRVVAEIRQAQIAQEQAAVGVGIGAHPALALRSEVGKFGMQFAGFVEQLPRT